MYENINQQIRSAIYNNQQQAITGDVLQTVLLAMVSATGSGSGFGGLAVQGSGTSIAVPEGKQWLLALNQSASAVSYGRYVSGATLDAYGFGIVYSVGSGWQFADIGGASTDANTLLGRIAAVVDEVSGIASEVSSLSDSVDAMSAAVATAQADISVAVAMQRGVHLSILSTSGTSIRLADRDPLYVVVDGTLRSSAVFKPTANVRHEAYILFDKEGEAIPDKSFTALTDCVGMKFPANVQSIADLGMLQTTALNLNVEFHNVTPPAIDNPAQFTDVSSCNVHGAAITEYNTAYGASINFSKIQY